MALFSQAQQAGGGMEEKLGPCGDVGISTGEEIIVESHLPALLPYSPERQGIIWETEFGGLAQVLARGSALS